MWKFIEFLVNNWGAIVVLVIGGTMAFATFFVAESEKKARRSRK